MGIRPGRIPDLEAVITGVLELVGGYVGAEARGLVRAARRYERASAWLELESRALVVRGHMRLRP